MFSLQPKLIKVCLILLVSSCSERTKEPPPTYEAFNSLMQTLEYSANFLKDQNGIYYAGIRSNYHDYVSREKASIWQPHALRVQKLTEEMIEFLKKIKHQLIVGTGINHRFGIYSLRDDQLRSRSKIFTDRNILKEISEQLKIYIDEAHNSDSVSDPYIKSYLASLKSDVISDTLLKKKQEGFFGDLPFISIFTFLLKYEILVRSVEHKLVRQFFALSKENVLHHGCEMNLPLIILDKSFVKAGETIELIAGMGNFNSNPRPIFTINQKTYKPGFDGTVSYKFKANGPGKHSFLVQIEFEKPDGSKERMVKRVYYEVARDSVSNQQ